MVVWSCFSYGDGDSYVVELQDIIVIYLHF
jgi:hypothetical protein